MQSVRRVLRVLAALASALCLGATGAQAQDATTTVVQAAARDWLAQADKGDTTATYDAAGEQFRAAMTRVGWSEALASVRKPLGAMQRGRLVIVQLAQFVSEAREVGEPEHDQRVDGSHQRAE